MYVLTLHQDCCQNNQTEHLFDDLDYVTLNYLEHGTAVLQFGYNIWKSVCSFLRTALAVVRGRWRAVGFLASHRLLVLVRVVVCSPYWSYKICAGDFRQINVVKDPFVHDLDPSVRGGQRQTIMRHAYL